MNTAQLFDWRTARAALNAGWRVRRLDWTDRWLERWTGGLVWILFSDGTKRVVQNTDFCAEEFLALDWTNLPPSCVTPGTTPGTGVNGCPSPYSPSAPYSPASPEDDPTPYVPDPVSPAFPDEPPSGWGGGEGGGGGGGGGGSGGGSKTPTIQNIQWPSLSVSATDRHDRRCYDREVLGMDTVYPVFIVEVSMSSVANYKGPSFFFVSVTNGPSVVGSGTLAPGGSVSFLWTDPLPATPGSTLVFNARAWAGGAPDLQGSGNGMLNPWCDAPCKPPHCCPGEDGHTCGTLPSGSSCCCCPGFYAPNGPECQCVYVG